MRKSLFSIVTASALLSGAGLASAQTTTTTTTQWTPEEGTAITTYSTTQHYLVQRSCPDANDRYDAARDRHGVPFAGDRGCSVAGRLQLRHHQWPPRRCGNHHPEGCPYLVIAARSEKGAPRAVARPSL